MSVKARILLGEDAPSVPSDEMDTDTLNRAAAAFRSADRESRDRYRRIEHERCLRFYYLMNWEYAPVGDDDARHHPLLIPYDELDEADKIRHDQSWELFEELSRQTLIQ